MPKSNTERGVAFKERNAALGRKELRGIWATSTEQEVLKSEMRKRLEGLRLSREQGLVKRP